ncbi:Adhesion G protein-coupled receptor A2 [Frankliniella fusca]|uniref:Adhesion G protein-coupled receptor A2 n=1 Tax=Frankliniella fusca TaxID=407009 RepID=A0AAE1HWJ1_9NEOP|nr:Adhesion G protein-coupled receptor A2 [Frankliniella fusca]
MNPTYEVSLLVVFVGLLSVTTQLQLQLDGCPSFCNCTKVKNGPLLKVRCSEKIDILDKLDLSVLAAQIIHLDVSRNNLEDLKTEYFKNFTNLKRLDLSYNKIKQLEDHAFQGLLNLEVLKLSNNNLTQITQGAVSHLKSLRKLDISSNPLHCDCAQSWLSDLAKNLSIKISPAPRCSSPAQAGGLTLAQWLENSSLVCGGSYHTLDLLKIHPKQDQIVFEGDRLQLQCHALLTGLDNPTISWSWGMQDPSSVFQDVHLENVNVSDNGTFQSSLIIDHLTSNHSGQWNCLLVSGQANHSRTVSVIVISQKTVYCPQTVTRSNKGTYVWPQTVVGFTAELPCEAFDFNSVSKHSAFYECSNEGKWQSLNTSLCPYASETTRLLQDFSKMNLSEEHGLAIVESARRLLNLSCGSPPPSDKMDAIFLSRAIFNYLKFLPKEKEVGSLLIDMVSCTIQMPRHILRAAQIEDQTCSRLVQSVESVTQYSSALQPLRASLAVEEFRVSHASFLGITCVWYSSDAEYIASGNSHSSKIFQCSEGNNTAFLSSQEDLIEASIQIPPSLLEKLGLPVLPSYQLLISMFENGHLFPRLNRNDSNDRWDVASSVIGAKLVGMNVHNLPDPLYIAVRGRETGGWTRPRPVWWDDDMNDGAGGWSEQGCTLSHLMHGKLVFYCDRFGYFGLLQELPFEFLERVPRGFLQLAHPAIYIGSSILILSLIIAIVTYVVVGPRIQMPKRTKHALINTWIAIALLSFMFSIGVHQTDDVELCQSIGVILHYLTLCSLLWMAITVSNMRKSTKKKNPLEMGSEDDLPSSSHPPPKPLLGLYLVGWGIGLMIVGVSGAVNLKQYRYIVEGEYCFLVPNSALGAVLVPCASVIVYLLVCALLVRCDLSQRQADTNAQLSDGTQGTENVDLDLLDCTVPVRPGMGSLSVGSTVSSEVEDAEHTPATQLRATLIVLLLFISLWAAGAFSTASQLHSLLPHAQLVFGTLYAVTASLLALFILFFHCFARSDVRPCWRVTPCRGRHVSDARTSELSQAAAGTSNKLPAEITTSEKVSNLEKSILPQSNGPTSNHISSSTSINSNKSNNQWAAVELNKAVESTGEELQEPHKASNMHLMPVYRSYPSVTDAEMFYNPRQSDMARKFFRKQKKHATGGKSQHDHARRLGDGEGNQSDMESTLRDSLKGSGSKVSNTNIHVEQAGNGTSPTHAHSCNILANETPPSTNHERWVIGADSPPTLNNDGTVRSFMSDNNSLSGRVLERNSSRRRRSRGGVSDANGLHERMRQKYHNGSHNGTISSVSSVRSRDVEMNDDFMRVSVVEEVPNIGSARKSPIYPWDNRSVVSGTMSLDPVSEVENDVCSMSRSSRHSSRSASSRKRYRRVEPPSLRSHPTSLASSTVSLQNRDNVACSNPVAEVDLTDDVEDANALHKKETCV